ncbi:ABC transporter ATP-binding protein [Nocardioides sp.]|uniref:energy-coupling factor ABC transporter ATP-binding protein n=1 Tax=Nocardioides sp. TaxID=35761 RepID=UPI00260316F8|nr:ABC transporter ATP-binding protein [Nocardioides sp.]
MIEFHAARVAVPDADPEIRSERELLAPTTLALGERRVAIIGSNGSGKSTLARLINGLITPTSGTVTVNGLDVARNGAKVRRQVGFCFTDPSAQMVMPTCVEDVELSLRRTHKDKRERRTAALDVLERYGLRERADQSVHTLSGGQRQMLALAGVLATDPAIVVADEPTTLLDLRNSRIVGDTLMGLDQQLILVTHDLDLAARCDRALVVEGARVVFDGPAPAAIEAYVGAVGR